MHRACDVRSARAYVAQGVEPDASALLVRQTSTGGLLREQKDVGCGSVRRGRCRAKSGRIEVERGLRPVREQPEIAKRSSSDTFCNEVHQSKSTHLSKTSAETTSRPASRTSSSHSDGLSCRWWLGSRMASNAIDGRGGVEVFGRALVLETEPSAGLQHARHLEQEAARIREVVRRHARGDDVEGRGLERQGMRHRRAVVDVRPFSAKLSAVSASIAGVMSLATTLAPAGRAPARCVLRRSQRRARGHPAGRQRAERAGRGRLPSRVDRARAVASASASRSARETAVGERRRVGAPPPARTGPASCEAVMQRAHRDSRVCSAGTSTEIVVCESATW